MKIYGHFLSVPSNKVRLAAAAIGQDFDYVHVELSKGEQKTPNYLGVNPVGKVPAMDDDGFYLSESNAIARYIADKNKSDLFPQRDLQRRAIVDQWIEFSSHHILQNMSKVLFNKFFAPVMGVDPDLQSMADGERFLHQYVPVVEKQLAAHPMLTGEKMTLADVAMIAALDPFEMIEFDLKPYPKLTAWRGKIMAQDFYQQVHSHYAADLKK